VEVTPVINHARTLLLNLPGSIVVPNYAGEEVIDPEFPGLNLPASLNSVHRILFGKQPSREMRNRLVWNYLLLLDASKLDQGLDPRVTYDLNVDIFSRFSMSRPQVTELGNTSYAGHLFNVDDKVESERYLFLRWRVVVTDSDQVRVYSYHNNNVTIFNDLDISGGKFSPIILPGSSLMFRGTNNVNDAWVISTTASPVITIPKVITQLKSLGTETINEIFQRSTPLGATDPYKTAFNIWSNDKFEIQATCALLIAYLHRLEAERQRTTHVELSDT
jgi:hypothetical protein